MTTEQGSNTITRRERLEARLTAEQKALLQRAADIEGRSLSEFVISSAQQAAEAIIRQHQVLTLTEAESHAFVTMLLNPPEPNERLRAAANQYQRRMNNDQKS